MSEENRPEETAVSTEVASPPDEQAKQPVKLTQTVEMRDVGPCRKHIKVAVDRKDIEARLGEQFSKLVSESNVAGFRPGKAPRKLVEKHFAKDVRDQVKNEVLLASLEQLADDHDVAPLAPPNIDPRKIELPKEGPLTYEFEVEVRPQFDLPPYKGLKLKRPVKTFTEDDVELAQRRVLSQHGQLVPKPEGNAQIGDLITVDVTSRLGDRVLGSAKEATIRVEKQLAFKDGIARRFADQIVGASAGDSRIVDVQLSDSVGDAAMHGQTVKTTFDVKDVKTLRLPELTHEFLHKFGVHTPEQFRERIRVLLGRQLEHEQRQRAREQVLTHIAAAATWELPEDMLRRQARKAMARRVMEMKSDGISEEEIARRERLLKQDILASTALALKEQFVLQKIAEVEKIEVDEKDVEDEIERMAAQTDESPRRLRARLEKDDLLETLAAEMVERQALDLILDTAEYEDVPLDQTEQLSTVEAQAIDAPMQDPSNEPPAFEEGAPPPPA